MPAYYDAHNHLQDSRLLPHTDSIFETLKSIGVAHCIVNGTSATDWHQVDELARNRSPILIPAFGLHPWFVKDATPDWKKALTSYLDKHPFCIGEIGLDRWIQGYDLPKQEEAFLYQLELAIERNLPVSIHCLRAWGKLLEILQSHAPQKGFLLHAYGGPAEMVAPLTKLGAYFSFAGNIALDRKTKQREALQKIPLDRLLIETDSPDITPPEKLLRHRIENPHDKKIINHPANIETIYSYIANFLQIPIEKLTAQIEENFKRLLPMS